MGSLPVPDAMSQILVIPGIGRDAPGAAVPAEPALPRAVAPFRLPGSGPSRAIMVAATVGLGQMVLNASNFLRTDVVVMGILAIGLVAWGFDWWMRWLEQHLVPWKGR